MKAISRSLSALLLGIVMVPGAHAQLPKKPGLGHTFFMRGQVVKAQGSEVVVCIGRSDGAQVGQSLSVIRIVERPGPSKGTALFDRQTVGTVRILNIIDDHFASVAVTTGNVKAHDLVELRR